MISNSRKRLSPLILIIAILCWLTLTFWSASDAQGQTSSFYEQLNPTGDPIGGNVGYRAIVLPDTADFLVHNASELTAALSNARSGDVIYVADEAEIDLTDEQDVTIPAGVTLSSGRGRNGSKGGLIFSNALYPDNTFIAMLKTGGPGVRVTGLRLRGPYGEIGDHHYDIVGVANGIRGSYGYLEVDNCEFWNWNKWAIDLEVAIGDHIHHNYIHHTMRSGYGYGVWVRGTGTGIPPSEDVIPLIEANLFDYSRHHIGSGSQDDSSWEARYNIALAHNVQQRFDRHGNADGAGHDTWIHHNWFIGTTDVDMAFRGPAGGSGLFYNNWTNEILARTSVAITNVPTGTPSHIDIYDNQYGGVDESWLPVAEGIASLSEGIAPLSITFDASGSTDPNGGTVVQYQWNFGDGDEALNEKSYGTQVQYTFASPGVYHVELMVFNEYGIPSPPQLIPVVVYPPNPPRYAVTGWIKDSYEGDKENYYTKQLLVGGTVVWEDDVSGAEGWYHLYVDITELIGDEDQVDLSFRVLAEQAVSNPAAEIVELFVYIDNLSVMGGHLENGDFESSGHWETFSSESDWRNTRASEEALTGTYSYLLGRKYLSATPMGSYAQISQTVSFLGDSAGMRKGDVNGSGEISTFDAVKVIQHIIGLDELSGDSLDAADVSGNGTISVYDASMILKYVAGMLICFPADTTCTGSD